jgi:uncharacterized membrane protein
MQNNFPWHIIYRTLILSVLAILLGVFFTGTLTLIGLGVNVATSESGGNPIAFWIGASITFTITLAILCKFIPAYRKQKKREEHDDLSKGIQ